MKELTKQGVGVTCRKAEPLTLDQENELWERNSSVMTLSGVCSMQCFGTTANCLECEEVTNIEL